MSKSINKDHPMESGKKPINWRLKAIIWLGVIGAVMTTVYPDSPQRHVADYLRSLF